MATAAPLPRNPLATRPQQHNTGMSISPCRTALKKTSAAIKRPLSPEPAETLTDHSSKRVKTTPSAPMVQESPTPAAAARMEARKDKERRREKERVQREEEFRIKYSRAFPNWVFYFDLDSGNPETALIRNHLEKRVGFMGAVSCMNFHVNDHLNFVACWRGCWSRAPLSAEDRRLLLERYHAFYRTTRCRRQGEQGEGRFKSRVTFCYCCSHWWSPCEPDQTTRPVRFRPCHLTCYCHPYCVL